MQRLAESTRAERQREEDAAVARFCAEQGVAMHTGDGKCGTCQPTDIDNAITCNTCRHRVDARQAECPYCHRHPRDERRAGDDGQLPVLDGLERASQAVSSTFPGSSPFWARKLLELIAMTESKDVGRPDLFITKTCHKDSADMKHLLRFLGCTPGQEATSWPSYQVMVTQRWRRNIMEWLHR